jgi:hypothetical protein
VTATLDVYRFPDTAGLGVSSTASLRGSVVTTGTWADVTRTTQFPAGATLAFSCASAGVEISTAGGAAQVRSSVGAQATIKLAVTYRGATREYTLDVVFFAPPTTAAFSVDRSFSLLFMVIIGGMGSIMGSFFGAAFIVVLPIFLNQAIPVLGGLLGFDVSTAFISHAEYMVFGALIVWFLIVEPHGLARLWSLGKQKLRVWPFPH